MTTVRERRRDRKLKHVLHHVQRPGPVLVILALAASLLLAWRTPATAVWLDVGSPGDESFTSGFFAAESNPVETFRWSQKQSTLKLPVERSGEYRVVLDLATVQPADRNLNIQCGDRTTDLDLDEYIGNFSASISCQSAGSQLTLTLNVPVTYITSDGRGLGVSVRDVEATALDSDDRLAIRTLAAALIFCSIIGIGLASRTIRQNAIWLGGPLLLLAGWCWLILRHPVLALPATSAPYGILMLAGGIDAWLLFKRRQLNACGIALLTPLILLIFTFRPVSLAIPGRWIETDVEAFKLLPWLVVLALIAAALIGGSRAYILALAATALSWSGIFLPPMMQLADENRKISISVPDWTATGSIIGAIYVLAVVGLVLAALLAAWQRTDRPLWTVMLVVALGMSGFLIWRMEIMRFNGDEPHYYVIARSLAADQDTDVLNNYLAPAYRNATISPDGNIAATRDFEANRYTSLSPGGVERWYLVPDQGSNWSVVNAAPHSLQVADSAQPLAQADDGAFARLPALQAAKRLNLLLDSPCRIDRIWIGIPDGNQAAVDLQWLDPAGNVLWNTSTHMSGSIGSVEIPRDLSSCSAAGPSTVRITAEDTELVALAVDITHHFQFIGARPAGGGTFPGLPRDRYASLDVLTSVLIHNSSDSTQQATIRQIAASEQVFVASSLDIAPHETIAKLFPVAGPDALLITAEDEGAIFTDVVGQVGGAEYRLTAAPEVERWNIPISAHPNRDAGVWLTVVNPGNDMLPVAVQGGDSSQTPRTLCGLCAATILLETHDRPRVATVSVPSGRTMLPGGIEYLERTNTLHFDLGLPLIAAPLARFSDPFLVLIIPTLAVIVLAPGLLLLLRAQGLSDRQAMLGAVAGTLLAPMSPFGVRLYTEILVAALIVWALVCWQRVQLQPRWHLAVLAIAMLLPLIHSRMIPLAAGLVGISFATLIHSLLRGTHKPNIAARQITLLTGALGLLALIALILGSYAIVHSSRDVSGYFQLAWVSRNLQGLLFDRGSGVLPFAPWILLGVFAPRPLTPIQRSAAILVLIGIGGLALRAGGWQTWGPPGRYLLPITPLMLLLVAPAVVRLWRTEIGRAAVSLFGIWSIGLTIMLHWLPLAGYVAYDGAPRYLIDETFRKLTGFSPLAIFPTLVPRAASGPLAEPGGLLLISAVTLCIIWLLVSLMRDPDNQVSRK